MNAAKPLDTTPDCAAPPKNLIQEAKARLPALLSSLTNITDCYNSIPLPPDRIVVAATMVKALVDDGHLRAAACHAIHQLIFEGLLSCEIILRGVPTLFRSGQGRSGIAMLEAEAPKEAPVFSGPVPYDELLIQSTSALWESWRMSSSNDPLGSDLLDESMKEILLRSERKEAEDAKRGVLAQEWRRASESAQHAAKELLNVTEELPNEQTANLIVAFVAAAKSFAKASHVEYPLAQLASRDDADAVSLKVFAAADTSAEAVRLVLDAISRQTPKLFNRVLRLLRDQLPERLIVAIVRCEAGMEPIDPAGFAPHCGISTEE